MAQFQLGRRDEARAILQRVQSRFESDLRLFELGRTFDSYGGLGSERLLMQEAAGLMQ
jgi:hypothetical protein